MDVSRSCAKSPEGQDCFDLSRFKDAQSGDYEAALAEVKRGRKQSHWMWYIFPQVAGLGRSGMAAYYAISGIEEARAYMRDPVLSERLVRITRAAMECGQRDAHRLFGSPDDLKFRSCMTLFQVAAPDEPVFAEALDFFFGGERDFRTLELLGLAD